MNEASLPIVAITMGDAAGIGPEVIMKSLGHAEVYRWCRPLVIGDADRLREAGGLVHSNLTLNSLNDVSQATFTVSIVD